MRFLWGTRMSPVFPAWICAEARRYGAWPEADSAYYDSGFLRTGSVSAR